MTTLQTIADRARQKRKSLGLTLDEVAMRSGISKSRISEIENSGQTERAGHIWIDTIEKIAEALETSPIWLCGWDAQTELREFDYALLAGYRTLRRFSDTDRKKILDVIHIFSKDYRI